MIIFHSMFFIILILIFSILIIIFLISKTECNTYKIRTYNISSDKINSNFRIVFLSDLHNKLYKDGNENLINDIVKAKPDIILLGGDLIDYSIKNKFLGILNIDNALNFIRILSEKISNINGKLNNNLNRIFFTPGNHELRLKENENDELKKKYDYFINWLIKNNIQILDNSYFDVNDFIRVHGLSLYKGYYGKNILHKVNAHIEDKILSKLKSEVDKKFNILLFHKPDYFEDFVNLGIDLTLSGHNHGGLIKFFRNKCLFSPDFKILPKYNYGMYEYKSFKLSDTKKLIVTSGIGEHFIKIRVHNKPEFCIIELNNGNNKL